MRTGHGGSFRTRSRMPELRDGRQYFLFWYFHDMTESITTTQEDGHVLDISQIIEQDDDHDLFTVRKKPSHLSIRVDDEKREVQPWDLVEPPQEEKYGFGGTQRSEVATSCVHFPPL